MHLQEQAIFAWQLALVQIPAPPFGESERAERLAEEFRRLGLQDIVIDDAGNAIGRMQGSEPKSGCVVLSAHIDTVFPAGTPIEPRVQDRRLYAPGACDNGAGIAGMLAVANALREAGMQPACDLYFVGNTGEEGNGDLRGMRHLYQYAPWRQEIHAHLVLDGAGDNAAITHALGSIRFRAQVTGPGGHSWTDAGAPNPILILSRAIARLGEIELPSSPRTTLNIGSIVGGTSINAIPERAEASFDLRSTDPEQLIRLEVDLYRAIEDAVLAANLELAVRTAGQRSALHLAAQRARFAVEKVGDRPAGRLPEDSVLMGQLLAVDRQLGLRTEPRIASTDANLPLSLGVPALTLGAGGRGGGIHTRTEWYDATGRELALRRVLLLLLAATESAANRTAA